MFCWAAGKVRGPERTITLPVPLDLPNVWNFYSPNSSLLKRGVGEATWLIMYSFSKQKYTQICLLVSGEKTGLRSYRAFQRTHKNALEVPLHSGLCSVCCCIREQMGFPVDCLRSVRSFHFSTAKTGLFSLLKRVMSSEEVIAHYCRGEGGSNVASII